MSPSEIPRRPPTARQTRQVRRHRLRVRVASLAVVLFLAAWLVIGVQMASSSATSAATSVKTTSTQAGSAQATTAQTTSAQATLSAPTAVTTHQS